MMVLMNAPVIKFGTQVMPHARTMQLLLVHQTNQQDIKK